VNKDLLQKVNAIAQSSLGRWSIVIAIGIGCAALALGGDPARIWGRYERAALENGEFWRLMTAHMVHLGWGHLWPNLLALLLLGSLFDDLLKPIEWLAAALAAALAIDLGLYAFEPQVQWYVGLSGVLHGFVAYGALRLIVRHSKLGVLLAVGVSAKLICEQLFGPMPWTESAAGGPVIIAAHLHGAAGGAAAAIVRTVVRGRRSQL
jgi:rhomboid family GlyGly-CTERM serine protease